jgi:hypothetical protein
MKKETGRNFIIGIYDDEEILLKAVENIRKNGVRIHEVFTPYAVHGLGHALGYSRSRLPVVAFFFGLLGCLLALWMQIWMMGIDWPMIIGGKDFVALPAFIPVTFELTVLLSALGMVGTFMVINDLKPYKKAKVFDIRSTDDKMVMAIDLGENKKSVDDIKSILLDTKVLEVYLKEFEL